MKCVVSREVGEGPAIIHEADVADLDHAVHIIENVTVIVAVAALLADVVHTAALAAGPQNVVAALALLMKNHAVVLLQEKVELLEGHTLLLDHRKGGREPARVRAETEQHPF